MEATMVGRLAVAVTLCMAVFGPAIPAQSPQCIALRIELPDGSHVDAPTPEGKATAGVQLKDGDDYRDFFIDLAIRDLGPVTASIRGSRDSDGPVLDDFDLVVGGEVRRTTTTPAFGLSVLRIYNRVGYTCKEQ
jgi:hypothetical protein